MILCVDIGNSRLKWAAGGLAGAWRAHGGWPLDEPLEPALAREWSGLPAPAGVVLCAVAGAAVVEGVTRWCRASWEREPDRVRPEASAHGVVNGYADPAGLGPDRWAALVAARQMAAHSVCVVDCGTAITVDALDAGGRFVAGAILPGLELARRALLQGTSAVRPRDAGEPDLRVRDTAQAVSAGILVGLGGAVDRLVDGVLAIAGEPATVILTGGNAPQVAPQLRRPAQHCPDLVLCGLRVIAGGRV